MVVFVDIFVMVLLLQNWVMDSRFVREMNCDEDFYTLLGCDISSTVSQMVVHSYCNSHLSV